VHNSKNSPRHIHDAPEVCVDLALEIFVRHELASQKLTPSTETAAKMLIF
jgi:hypothetical protein